MEKQNLIYLLISVAAVVLLPAAHAASIASPSSGIDALSIYSLQINPNPVYAGENVTINLQLYDSYYSTLNNINLELEGSYPILNVSPSNPYLLSSAGPGLYGGSSSYFTYTIRIPKNTPSGNYTLDLVANYQTTQTVSGASTTVTGSSVMPINFYVHGNPHVLLNPSASGAVPGQQSSIMFDVINSGYGKAKNITISLANTTEFSVVGAKTFFIGSLPIEGTSEIAATYLANDYMANGTYYLPVHVTYQSSEGVSYNQTINQAIDVKVQNPNVVLSVLSANPSTLYTGYNQTLMISVENVGYGNAKNVSIALFPTNGISILSSVNNFFIGNLAPGQSTTESVLVASGNHTNGSAGLNAKVGYYSTNYRNRFYKNQTLNITIAPSAIFSIGSANYKIAPGQTTVPINFTITNTGTISAEELQLNFQSTYPITPVSGSGYIQELKPGQTENVTFMVSVDSRGSAGDYPVTIYETWRQPNGAVQQTYSGSNGYYAVVSGGSENGGSAYGSYVIAIVVIAVVVFVLYLRVLKPRSAKKKTPKAL